MPILAGEVHWLEVHKGKEHTPTFKTLLVLLFELDRKTSQIYETGGRINNITKKS